MDRLTVLAQYMIDNRKRFPKDQIESVRDALARMDDVTFQIAVNHKLKSPGVAFALALFLPGFDRFYLGSVGMGILQIMLLNALTLGILPLIHLFTVWSETRKKNLKMITQEIK